MLEKTTRLVAQFHVLKRQIVQMPQPAAAGFKPHQKTPGQSSDDSTSTSTHRSNELPGRPKSRPQPPLDSLKRARQSDDESDQDVPVPESSEPRTHPVTQNQSPPPRSQKRKRLDRIIAGADEEVRDVTPLSVETEDISEEVQRRLEIKDKQRKKRSASKVDKRKRDSMNSNGSTSSPGTVTKHLKKKARLGTGR
ncbi:hypothetical protein BO70DRAFT_366449 [Aspergillus heteromorphus CBS 117.55]|uniref:Uncharacterized protein n=1 Tax=Aspergillus heteromorphus CBS 117.55 TaxID=1448321 RepID=A0A317V102_9EURO|nr:uncharacterized protein BO70DRAFT_366449 [Aspergillus heteromorphus CBS 117.55]PWY66758.1 hypothetical protein BO70DRAFT_366449 [Aspergillus heteromorphus CBS 117.55]